MALCIEGKKIKSSRSKGKEIFSDGDEPKITLTVSASDGTFIVPVAGMLNWDYCDYSWKIKVNGEKEEEYSGFGDPVEGIFLSNLSTSTNNTIEITPIIEEDGWARAFGFGDWETGVSDILNTEKLRNIKIEGEIHPFVPKGMTDVDDYLYYTFYGCTSLTTAPIIPALPSSVTSASYYLWYTFGGCTHLATIPSTFKFDNRIASIGGNTYCDKTFYNTGSAISGTISGTTAAAIINGVATPTSDKNTFSSKFSDYASLPTNWKQ
jgi:hypothetical protein